MSKCSGPCYYCGAAADGVDHVIPQSYLRKLEALGDEDLKMSVLNRRKLTVSCCHECNSLLGGTIQKTLEDRKRFLKQKLRRRYSKLLKSPDWTEAEIGELGDGLQQYVRQGAESKEYIRHRIAW